MSKKEIIQAFTILITGCVLVVASSWFSKKEKVIQLSTDISRPVVECPRDTQSYEQTKSKKNIVLVNNLSTFGKKGKFINEKKITVKRSGLNSKIACGYLFYRVSVGDRPINQKYENIAIQPTGGQFGGHIIPSSDDFITNKDVNNKTEILIPLDSITYDGTARTNFKKSDWASLLNASDHIDFDIALNTTNDKGKIDSVEIVYKCWNPKTGQETDDCLLEVEK